MQQGEFVVRSGTTCGAADRLRTASAAAVDALFGASWRRMKGGGNPRLHPRFLEHLEKRLLFDSTVAFNEIMYHPAGDESKLEWLELHNQQAVPMDLSGWSIQNGIQYTFPAATILQGGQNLVLSISPADLKAATGLTTVYGPYTGRLSNSGEQLDLDDNDGRVIDSVTYGASGAWPVAPDGSGVSLAKINSDAASDVAASWAASATVGGTPGATNFPSGVATPALALNEISANSGGFVEIANLSGSSQAVGGYLLVDSALPTDQYALPVATVASHGFISYTPAQMGFTPVSGDDLFLETPDGKTVLDAQMVQDTLQGRSPDGTGAWLTPSAPTPGAANTFALNNQVVVNEIMYDHQPQQPATGSTSSTTTIEVNNNSWKYNQSGTDQGTAWQASSFNDSSWPTGQGVFYGGSVPGVVGAALSPVPITTVFGTGLSATGTALASGATDSHYTVTVPGATSSVPTLEMTPNSAWAADNSTSGWISPNALGNANQAAGSYVYITTFDLSGYLSGTAALTMTVFADNQVTNVKINGVSTGISGPDSGFAAGSGPFSITSGFVPGVNTLEFDVNNDGTTANPAGFRAAVSGTADPVPKNTQLTLGPKTYYFRNTFNYSGGVANTTLTLNTEIDDGAVFYLNGVEIYRQNMPNGAITFTTSATSAVGTPGFAAPITLPSSALKVGTNVLAVEVHQVGSDTSDVAMGAQLLVTTTIPSVPFSDSSEQWIELYNRGSQSVSLTGWTLGGGISYSFPSGTTIGAGQYLVVSNDSATLSAEYPSAQIIGNFSGKLAHGGDTIEVLDASGNPDDSVTYDKDKPWPGAPDGGGSSLELRDPNADNSNASAWAASNETNKSTWQTYTYSAAAANLNGDPTQWHELDIGLLDTGEMLLDDVHVVDVTAGNVEQLQNSTFETGSTTWRLLGNESHSKVIVDPTNPANHVLDLIATGGTESMSNHIETTFAGNVAIVEGHVYQITFRAKWISGSNLFNTRLYFNQVSQTTALLVPQNNGTPGAQNSTFQSDIGPTYTGLSQNIIMPAANQAVAVSVHADSPHGVSSISLFYSVNGGTWSNTAMSLVSGDLYSGTIPGQAAAAIVQFYAQGTDSLAAVSTYPAAGVNSRALYQVNDGVALSTTGEHTIRIILTPADNALLYTNTNLMSNDLIGATAVYDNSQIFYDVGTQLHSSERGRDDSTRVGFDIDFNSDHLFRGTQGSVTIDRSGTGGRNQDEILIKQAIDHGGGVPGVYDDIVKVIAPNSANTGSGLLQMGPYNNSYWDDLYKNGGDGNLYKFELIYYPTQTTDGNPQSLKVPQNDNVIPVDLTNLGPSKEDYRYHFLLESHADEDDFAPVEAMASAFNLSGTALDTATQSLLDVKEWLRTFAYQSLSGATDTYTEGFPHNMKFYQRPTDGKMLAIPWDWDQSFSNSTTAGLVGSGNVDNMITLANNYHYYLGDLQDLITTTFNTTYMNQWVTAYGALANQGYSADMTYITSRANFVTSQLPAAQSFTITSTFTQPVTTPTVTLTGKGWINVSQIFVQGSTVPLNVTWSGTTASMPTTWTATVPLNAGVNNLTLQAVNFEGAVVGTATISVTSTSNVPSPVNNLRVTEMMYDPPPPATGVADDYEFIELQNINTTQSLDVSGASFNTGIAYTFPAGSVLMPGQRIVLARTAAAFTARYPGVTIFGLYTGKLDNSGEEITLISATGATIEDFTYSPDWYPDTAGVGFSLVVDNPNSTADLTVANNPLDFATGWRSSNNFDGAPGAADPGTNGDAVVINEVLSHTDDPSGDYIELYNTTTAAIDISGWYLSDSSTNLTAYQIQSGTVIAAGGYLVFSEFAQFGVSGNPGVNTAFSLSKTGDQVYLSSLDSSVPASPQAGGYREVVKFGAAQNGVTFGRYVNSVGQADFVSDVSPTPGAANSAPIIGPIVINELNYDPAGGLSEYIELRNITGAPVPLYDPANPANTWQFINGITYTFPTGVIIPAYGYLVVSSVAPATFRTQYPTMSTNVQVFGPYTLADGTNNLNNAGEELTLNRPLPPDQAGAVYYPVEDDVTYSDLAPWPTTPHAGGPSLERFVSAAFGDDPINWTAGPTNGTPGAANGAPGVLSAVYASAPASTLTFSFSSDVSASLSTADLVVTNISNPASPVIISTAAIRLAWNSSTDTATFTFDPATYPSGILPTGTYTATLVAAGITSGPTGQKLDGTNGDTPGNDYTLSFSALPPPHVTGVYVGSDGWTPAFLTNLAATGAGSAAYGFAAAAGSSQSVSLPWINIDELSMSFDEPISAASLSQASLGLYGVNTASYTLPVPVLSADGLTLTWILSGALNTDRMEFAVSKLTNVNGTQLDGAWSNNSSSFPSGNGTAGSAFDFTFNILPGDVDNTGAVNIVDTISTRNRQFTGPGDTNYSPFFDVDGSGGISIVDTIDVRNRQFTALPAGTPLLPQGGTANPSIPTDRGPILTPVKKPSPIPIVVIPPKTVTPVPVKATILTPSFTTIKKASPAPAAAVASVSPDVKKKVLTVVQLEGK